MISRELANRGGMVSRGSWLIGEGRGIGRGEEKKLFGSERREGKKLFGSERREGKKLFGS